MMVPALLFILKLYSIKKKKMNHDIEGVEGFRKAGADLSFILPLPFASF
jgi:hypothetical protein